MPNALTAQPNGMPMQAQQAPAPDHAQTVAALRHFYMIGKELRGLLADPNVGKSDMRSALIDSVTKLVGDRIVPPTAAVQQMASFPDRPFEQKTWLQNMLQHVQMANVAVLSHHGQAFAGQPPQPVPDKSADNHIDTMSGMMQSHYPQNNNQGQQNA
jgi:hypothetical protein